MRNLGLEVKYFGENGGFVFRSPPDTGPKVMVMAFTDSGLPEKDGEGRQGTPDSVALKFGDEAPVYLIGVDAVTCALTDFVRKSTVAVAEA